MTSPWLDAGGPILPGMRVRQSGEWWRAEWEAAANAIVLLQRGAGEWLVEAEGIDGSDGATVGAMLGAVRAAFDDPTIHLAPDTRDRYEDAEPYIVWHVNRHHQGEDEWLRESGAWGAMEDGHRDPPIAAIDEESALAAAWASRPA